ncbi:hypothetical protein QR680_002520 [Steinernema hermaphroditum]|uniref:RRM domain-containing protein n=1 Tax=Steinernema hermaphroditum TaxID=289476 RepID=A0AA39LIF3_9BILA|nr:hypothetical protein QR680_002520 [Steinernema hermaphroditum]
MAFTEAERAVIFADVQQGGKDEADLKVAIQLIEVELDKGDPSSIQDAFELALSVHPTVVLLWLKYLHWLDNSLKIPSKAAEVYERAVIVNPMSTEIMQLALIAYERAGESSEKIEELWEVAKNSIVDPDWGRSLFTTYIFLLKRRVVQSESKDFSIVEEAFEDGCTFLSHRFRFWDQMFKYRLMHAYFHYSTTKNYGKARDIVRDILATGGNTQPKVAIEAISYERHFGRDMIRCRHMLYQAVNSVTENAFLLFDYFIQFEREEGTLEELGKALSKVNSQAKRLQQRDEQMRVQRLTASPLKTKKDSPVASRENGSKLHAKRKLQLLSEDNENTEKSVAKRDKDGFVVPTIPSRLAKNKEMDVDSGSSDATVGPASIIVSVHAEVNDINADVDEQATVFVSNLGYNATVEEIASLFDNVKQVWLSGAGKGKQSKGYGSVTFNTAEDASNALKKDRVKLNGRPVFVSKYKKKKEGDVGKSDFRYSVGLEKNKLYVSNVHFDCSEEKLREVFGAFGSVKAVRIVTHKSGRPKGCAYVELDSESSAQKAINSPAIEILGRPVKVALSNPPKKDQLTPAIKGHGMHRRIGSMTNGNDETENKNVDSGEKPKKTKLSNDEFRKFL